MTRPTTVFTESLSPRRLRAAWENVAAADGAPGTDGVTVAEWSLDWETRLRELATEVRTGQYQPCRLRPAAIPKTTGGLRTVHIANVTDRVLLRSIHDVMEDRFDERFLDCSFGYRPGRGVHGAVREVIRWRRRRYLWVLDADIDDFFASIAHDQILRRLWQWTTDRRLMRLVRQWLTSAACPDHPHCGIPLGLPICPMLSNIMLHDLDVAVSKAGWPMVRYADDFCVFTRRRRDAHQAYDGIAETLAEMDLAYNTDKTRVTHFQDVFVFVGVRFGRRGQQVLAGRRWLPMSPDAPWWRNYTPPGYGPVK